MQDHIHEHEEIARAQTSDPPTSNTTQPIFSPRAYLMQYYQTVDPGNQALLRFYAQIYKDLAGRSMLEFGGGPTIYSVISAARTAGWIHFCDYKQESLEEVRNWLAGKATAFDWTPYTRFALECEKAGSVPTEENIKERENLIRQKVRKLSPCNIFEDDPLLGTSEGPYGVVAQTFVLDSIIQDKDEWVHLHQKLVQQIEKHGLYISVSILNASYWTVDNNRYSAVSIMPDDITSLYSKLGFEITSLVVEPLSGKIGYDGFIMACGQRK